MSNIIKSYNDFAVTFEEMNSEIWFNATQAAKHFGKRVPEWLRLPTTQSYIAAISENMEKSHVLENHAKNVVLIRQKQGRNGGTWLHRDLAIEFVRWLDVRFAIAFNKMVEEILLGHSAKTEALKRIVLQVPSVWQKTFPDEFFAALLKCWCDESVTFNRAHGTPSFCGWFINKFIYEHLWVGLPQELKARRKEFSTDSDESLYDMIFNKTIQKY